MSLFEIGKKLISLFKGEYTIKRKFRGDEKKRLQNKIKEYKVYEGIEFAEHNTVLHEIDTLHDFHLIPEIPVIEFNEYQSKNLISSIIDLKNTYDEVGAVKIRLHPKHLPKLSLLKSQKKLFVRQQVIPLLSEGKPFVNIENAYTFQEFKEYLQDYEKGYRFSEPKCSDFNLQAEREYFKILHGKYRILLSYLRLVKEFEEDEEEFTVEYGSDLPVDVYAKSQTNNDFSLSQVSQLDDSLFQLVKTKGGSISGIVIPWAYVGGLFSTFCWHTEDLFLYSLNYMHEGGVKTWYVIPIDDVEKVKEFLRKKYAKQLITRPNLLNEVTIFFSPLEMVKEGIRVYKSNQQKGDLIVTLPGVYHGGFSNSFNICEAVNLATADWIDAGWKFKEIDEIEGSIKMTCFSLDWIIFESYINRFRLSLSQSSIEILEDEFRSLAQLELKCRNKSREIFLIEEEELIETDKIKYYDYSCLLCNNYFYLSWLGCEKCQGLFCLRHLSKCSCKGKPILYKRFEDEEITSMINPEKSNQTK